MYIADHDHDPHRYPVLEVGPMVRSVTSLTVILTLSLKRPHICKDARPEALAGPTSPPPPSTTHATRVPFDFVTLEKKDSKKFKCMRQLTTKSEVT